MRRTGRNHHINPKTGRTCNSSMELQNQKILGEGRDLRGSIRLVCD